METNDLQQQTGLLFQEFFGRTPLTARLDDMLGEAMELHRATDIPNLKEEAGDLGASLLALCQECGFNFQDLVLESHAKIRRRAQQYHSLGRKTKVALLGGAFDPPTLGHIAVAKFVLDSSRTFDEVWLVPCFRHMYNKQLSAEHHRLAMCRLAITDARMQVFGYEIDHQLRGETYHFVQKLLTEKYAQDEYDFSIIIGMDNANTFDRWVNFRELERMIRFVVVPRPGEIQNPKVDWYLRPPHIFLRDDGGIIPGTSSTATRKLIQQLIDVRPMAQVFLATLAKEVGPAVAKYIWDHKLYGLEATPFAEGR